MQDEWYIKVVDGERFVYHRFTFDPRIQEHTFIGNDFIGMDRVEETRNLQMIDRVVEAGPYGFMPNLAEELKNIFGEGNYEYDGYEIGEEDFGLYFFIKEKLLKDLLKKVELWADLNDIKEYIYWDDRLDQSKDET
ncbi:MAG: hypothetical protein O6940_09020 [Ignavibacteria bacterium]|nr:hypothetical protein [Ignavibacteria bacterium]